MTTNSEASIGRSALLQLKDEAPEVYARIDKIKGKSIGRIRLAQVYFKDGTFQQFAFGMKGTHTGQLITQLVAKLKTI